MSDKEKLIAILNSIDNDDFFSYLLKFVTGIIKLNQKGD